MIDEVIKQGFELLKQFKIQEAMNIFQALEKSQVNNKSVLFGYACALIMHSEVDTQRQQQLLQQAQLFLQQALEIDSEYEEAFAKLEVVQAKLTALSASNRVALAPSSKSGAVDFDLLQSAAAQPRLRRSALITMFSKSLTRQEKIGHGVFGVVYRGQCGGSTVAIKRIEVKALGGVDFKAFIDETAVLMSLDSPYLLRCQDIVVMPNNYCLVLDYMPKGSLWQWLHDTGRSFTLQQQTHVATDIVHGLNVLHNKNIVHGDLKSPNVLIDQQDRAKLADFGLARVKTRVTGANMVGTLAWLAPEILIHQKNHSTATDVYSLGLVFWEIVTRLTPYDNKSALSIWHAKIRGEAENIPSSCPPRFSQAIRHCWLVPEQRPSATQLADKWCQQDVASCHFN